MRDRQTQLSFARIEINFTIPLARGNRNQIRLMKNPAPSARKSADGPLSG
jgi:hypothetical protein